MSEIYDEKEFNMDFITLLHKYKYNLCYTYISNMKEHPSYKSDHYYSTFSFRTLLCEIIYQAIQMFPRIKEYQILCQNNKGKSKITIGFLEERDNEDEPGLIKVENKHGTFVLNKVDVHNIYIFNRCPDGDPDIINNVLLCLYLDGDQPTLKTNIISFPADKGKEKFK